MKLLLTVHQFFPEYSLGTESLTFQVAKELQFRGHEVCVFTGYPSQVLINESRHFDSYTYEGIKVIRFHHNSLPYGKDNAMEIEYNNLFFATFFRKYLSEYKPDVVHFFHLSRLSASPIDICVELGIPTVMTTTDFWLICPTGHLHLPDGSLCNGPDANSVNCLRHLVEISQPPKTKNKLRVLPNWLVALLIWNIKHKLSPKMWFTSYVRALISRPSFLKNRMNQIDSILVPTHLMQNVLQKHGLHPKRVLFMPYGVDVKNIERGKDKGTMNQLRVGFIGTLYEHKGAHLLIEAVQRLLLEIPIELKIYGGSEQFPKFLKYASRLHEISKDDPRITFCGTFPNKDIGKVFSELDVLVVPSVWYENTPLVIYSAQTAGCPIIATDVSGISEVVHHEVNGLLFERGNVFELAKSIRRLHEDRVLLSMLAKNSVSPKSIQEYVSELENIYGNTTVEAF